MNQLDFKFHAKVVGIFWEQQMDQYFATEMERFINFPLERLLMVTKIRMFCDGMMPR